MHLSIITTAKLTVVRERFIRKSAVWLATTKEILKKKSVSFELSVDYPLIPSTIFVASLLDESAAKFAPKR